MPNQFQSLLDEFSYAVKHFVPTLPQNLKNEAQQTLERLMSDPNADEKVIKKAFYEIGVKEYPYRRAYLELTSSKAVKELNALVLDHVDPIVRDVIKQHLDSGVSLQELVSSDLFEKQLTPEQRYQVEDGILVAQSKLAEELREHISDQDEAYQTLVEKWEDRAKEIEKAISTLESMAGQGDDNQKQEILNKVERYREGFLITETDPKLSEVKKEIEYWEETFAPAE